MLSAAPTDVSPTIVCKSDHDNALTSDDDAVVDIFAIPCRYSGLCNGTVGDTVRNALPFRIKFSNIYINIKNMIATIQSK